jgi:DNA-binding protein HU-beta
MRKNALVQAVSKRASVTWADARASIEALEDEIMDELRRGGKVFFPRLGVVAVQRRGARVGRNPKTGEEVRIKARTKPVFRPTRGLLDAVERSHDTSSLA